MRKELEVSIAVLLTGLGLIYIRRREKAQQLPLPPGPEAEFLIGNLRHMPKEREWAAYAKMSEDHNSKYAGVIFALCSNDMARRHHFA